jgi:hypothetical protein
MRGKRVKTMHIELPEAIAEQVREAANNDGLDTDSFVLKIVEERLHQESNISPTQKTDAELIQFITRGFTESFWQRYAELRQKLKAEIITEIEHEELLSLSDEKEIYDAKRLKYLIELSQRRQTSVENLMQEMGIRPLSLAA